MRALTNITILLTFVLNGILAQETSFNTVHVYDAVSRGLIKDVIVDDLGFLWLATDAGVTRFDGEEVIHFKREIEGGFAKKIVLGQEGSLLVTYDYGVSEIISKSDTSIFVQLLGGGAVKGKSQVFYPKAIFKDQNNRIWIGENSAIRCLENDQLKNYDFTGEERTNDIFNNFSFFETSNQEIWVFALSGNLYHFDERLDIFVQYLLDVKIEKVTEVVQIKKDHFWVAAENGIFELKLNSEKKVRSKAIFDIPGVSCAALINDNHFFIGTRSEGLYYVDLVAKELHAGKIKEIPFNDIVSIYPDPQNGLWVASNEKLLLLSQGIFKNQSFATSDIPVEAMVLLNGVQLLAGVGDQFMVLEKEDKEWMKTKPFLEAPVVPTSFLVDSNLLWVGDFNGQLYYTDQEDKFLHKLDDIPSSFSRLTCITKDQSGNIWATGNQSTGLIKVNNKRLAKTYQSESLADSRTIIQSDYSGLIVGSKGKKTYLYLYDPTRDSFFNISTPLPFEVDDNFVVVDVLMTNRSTLLMATSEGLLSYDFRQGLDEEERVKRIDLGKVSINEPIKAIQAPAENQYWIATESGLINYNPENQSSLIFDKTSGLPSNNITYRGLLLDVESNLWVATSRGLGYFPSDAGQRRKTPSPLITSLLVNGNTISSTSQEIGLSYQSLLKIEYHCPDYPTDKIKYQHRIIERDTHWSKPVLQEQLTFSGFQPGPYRIQIRAQQHGGYQWSNPVNLEIIINRPWFRQWWAILLFALVAILLIYIVAKLYNQSLIEQNEKLERIIKNRTEEINRQKNEIIEQNAQMRKLTEEQLKNEIENRDKQLTTYTLNMIQKNESLKELQQQIIKGIRNNKKEVSSGDLKKYLSLIDYSFRKDREWENFKLYFEKVHVGFFENIKLTYPELTVLDLRHCSLIRLNLSLEETATIMAVSTESVKTARYRLKKKMGLEAQQELTDRIMQL